MLSPEYKIKQEIINLALAWDDKPPVNLSTEEEVDKLWDEFDYLCDAKSEIREGDVETDVPCDYSRHYESKSVAMKCVDGTWVGWTYWYGGGKHGEPEAVDWMEYAYNLDVKEEEKLVVVRTFAKVDENEV